MGRKANWPPKIHSHPSGLARVTYKGHDYYLKEPPGSAEAEAEYAALLVRLKSGEFEHKKVCAAQAKLSPLTVADVIARFLEAAQTDWSAHQLKGFRVACGPLLRVSGAMLAASFGVHALEEVRAAMLSGSWIDERGRAYRQKHGQPIGWCRTTVARNLTRIGTIWKWAEYKGLVPEGRYGALRALPKLRKKAPGVREPVKRQGTLRETLDAVLPHVQRGRKHRPCAAMLQVQHLTGMRTGEVCIMRPCDLDREGGPSIDGQKVWLYKPEHHKTEYLDQTRVVAIGPAAQAILAPWLLKCPAPDAYLFQPGPNGRGSPHYGVRTYDGIIATACKRAGVKLIPYGGRRATADRVRKEYGLDGARSVLGHTSVSQTVEYCEQLDVQQAAEIAAKLG